MVDTVMEIKSSFIEVCKADIKKKKELEPGIQDESFSSASKKEIRIRSSNQIVN